MLCPRILCWIRQGLRLVVGDVLDAEILEHLEECLADVREGNCTVVRIALLDEHVAIEAAHLRNSEDTDTTERACRNVEHFTFCDVRAEVALRVALQAIECDVAGCDVALESTTSEVWLATVLEQTVLNELILDLAVRAHLALRSVTAVEAHEGVGELVAVLADDVLVVDVLWYRVVDVEQSNCVVACAHTDVLRESTVDVNLAGTRNTAAYETAVYVARLETELAWECRPALVGECYILA